MRATIRDVAERANVCQTTVSLAFRSKSRISEATRKRVLAAARRLNYVPNMAARHLRHGQPRTLGILVNDITNPFYAAMARTVELTAEKNGYQVIITESQWDAGREVAHLERMLEARIRGAIVCLCEKTDESLRLLERFALPHVALDTYPAGYQGAYVVNDITYAGRLAAEHLAAVGCKCPALVIPKQKDWYFSSFRRLRQGFAQTLRRLGISFGPDHVLDAALTVEEGIRGFGRVEESLPKVDGILCGNDLCALGVMEAARRAGKCVGRDIAVMGIDDLDVSRLECASLTSIRQPNVAIAQEATHALIRSIEAEEKVAIRKAMKPELIVRGSTCRQAPYVMATAGHDESEEEESEKCVMSLSGG